MTPKAKVILTVVVFTVIGFLLESNSPIGGMIWPPNAENPEPVGAQLPLLVLYGVLAAIGFGCAVAFLLFGRSLVSPLGLSGAMTTATHLSVVWLLGNWVIHDSLHIANGHNLWGLIAIEYAFHGTLIVAGLVLAAAMRAVARKKTGSAPSPPAA